MGVVTEHCNFDGTAICDKVVTSGGGDSEHCKLRWHRNQIHSYRETLMHSTHFLAEQISGDLQNIFKDLKCLTLNSEVWNAAILLSLSLN